MFSWLAFLFFLFEIVGIVANVTADSWIIDFPAKIWSGVWADTPDEFFLSLLSLAELF